GQGRAREPMETRTGASSVHRHRWHSPFNEEWRRCAVVSPAWPGAATTSAEPPECGSVDSARIPGNQRGALPTVCADPPCDVTCAMRALGPQAGRPQRETPPPVERD